MLGNVLVPAEMNTVDWLQLQAEGVYVLRLHGIDSRQRQVDHFVTADAKARRIWDLAEKFGTQS